jgi:hypothetical protein
MRQRSRARLTGWYLDQWVGPVWLVALAGQAPVARSETGRVLLASHEYSVERTAELLERPFRKTKMCPLENCDHRQADHRKDPQRTVEHDNLKMAQEMPLPRRTVTVIVIAVKGVHKLHPDDELPVRLEHSMHFLHHDPWFEEVCQRILADNHVHRGIFAGQALGIASERGFTAPKMSDVEIAVAIAACLQSVP